MTKTETPGDARPVRSGLPVLPPLVVLAEILVLMVLPALLDYFVPQFPSLSQTQPHFFWLPVLLVSLQYGTVSGLLAAGVAIVLTAWLGWPEQEIGENHFSYLLRVWTQPVLWLAAALLLGQFRLRQIEDAQAMSHELAVYAEQRGRMAQYAEQLRARCDDLERELACRTLPPSGALLDALNAARSGRSSLQEALGQCFGAAFLPCRTSVYAADAGGLRLLAAHADPAAPGDPDPAPSSFPAGHPVIAAVIGEGRPLSVLVPGDEAALAGFGLVAVPIEAPADGRVVGVLKLDAADPSDLDADTAGSLAVIAASLAPLVAAARGLADLQPPRVKPGPRLRLWRQVKWRRLRQPQDHSSFRSTRVG
jgi:hypothetical protein